MSHQLIGAYGEPQDVRDWDLMRLAYEYRNTQDREALNIIAAEIERRQNLLNEVLGASLSLPKQAQREPT